MSQATHKSMRWNSLDCLKGIACIAVVLIHYNISGGNIPAWIGAYTKALCRFAVPVFLPGLDEHLLADETVSPDGDPGGPADFEKFLRV